MILRKLRADERGATAIEYGLIAALIVIAMMGGLKLWAEASGACGRKHQQHVEQFDG